MRWPARTWAGHLLAAHEGEMLMKLNPMSSGAVLAAPGSGAPPPTRPKDGRRAQISPMARLLRRPEIGAAIAAIVIAIFFETQSSLFLKLDGISNWTDVASTIGIPAVLVALLMIGGEFDLSAGGMTGSPRPVDWGPLH